MQGLGGVPPQVAARVIARCGVAHPFADPLAREMALVVIDLHNAFLDDAVGYAVCPAGRDIVPQVNRIAGALRAAGGGVFWMMDTFDPGAAEEWRSLRALLTPEARARREAAGVKGSVGQQLWPGLDVRKYRFSAFLPGASDLADLLRARGFDTVLIAGLVTNACCASSARDAMMLNFRTVMVSDANAAMTPEEHRASLPGRYSLFGDVMETDFVLANLARNSHGARRGVRGRA